MSPVHDKHSRLHDRLGRVELAPKLEGLTYCKQDHAYQSLQAILTSLVHSGAFSTQYGRRCFVSNRNFRDVGAKLSDKGKMDELLGSYLLSTVDGKG